MRSSLHRRGIVLGLLIAVGGFAIDLYIPAFAAIARDLRTDPGRVQLTMTAYFLAVGVGQVVYGPISDAIGRRRPIFAGLAVFVAGSVWAALAPSIDALIAARLLQGFGAAATAVVPLAVISDEYEGPDAARLLTLAMLSLSVSPILAPTLGGLLVQFGSWRLIFIVLTAVAAAGAAMVARMLPETLPPERRTSAEPRRIAATYAGLIADRRFIAPLAVAGFGQSVLLTFIAGSPFVFVTLHGMPPALFGGLFALHAAALIGVSQSAAALLRRFGARRVLGAASLVCAAAGLLLGCLAASGVTALVPFVALTLVIFTSLGLVMPVGFMTAVGPFAATAGAAAALGVALELAMSTTATLVLSASQDGTARPMALIMAAASCGACITWMTFAPAPETAVTG
jgi:DHA1 family bicyclomycin/chloramphenicol resistance-like MFS transporter